MTEPRPPAVYRHGSMRDAGTGLAGWRARLARASRDLAEDLVEALAPLDGLRQEVGRARRELARARVMAIELRRATAASRGESVGPVEERETDALLVRLRVLAGS